ncbi:efflux RND transporter permease subunit [Colwellia psychrerythraea]|uniref:AcrB/AcrD/AcrF family protein n=1 Tax=Colwellia psychrerythraea (strain 34H / ATCC BAA-681) TaxID=167879 RepID=Q481J1_COLP3|nr:efflux RND transporter permease subunit [Colwellia psychrerythraea]AAZ24982.1 AcrB/AcrD/AcrF family protein [Colwellia psychrerythraea 34H]
MNITRLAITNNRTTFMLLLVIVFFGINAFKNMPKDYDPGFIIRTAQVITQFPGASPQRVEMLVTDKLERVIQELPELDFVKSESRTGISIISVNIKESYRDLRPIWDNLRRKIEAAQVELPAESQPSVVNDEFGDVFGIVIGLTAEGYDYRELKDIADQTRDAMLRLSETAKVQVFGEQQEHIFLEYDNAHLASLGISPSQLSDQLSSRNIIISGGSIIIDNEQITLEPSGNFENVDEIKRTIIQIPGSDRLLYLSDLVTIKRSYVDPVQSKVSLSGEQGISIAIAMRHGGNNILLGQQVNELLATLNKSYPIGVNFEAVSFLPFDVEKKVDDFSGNLIQAVIVVTLVMLFSLGFRTGLIVAVLIPTSMIFAILIMSLLNIGIDQISLAALIIALGMLVDNGIVMSENIMVSMEKGKNAIDAAVDSANELKVPLLTSSLTTAAAFLPIFLAESSTGEYTASLFKVVSITLLCSWVLSMTVIPMLCVNFMKVKKTTGQVDSPLLVTYRTLLKNLLRFRWLTLSITFVMIIISVWGLSFIPKLFFPPSDRAFFKMELEMPIGTTLAATERVTQSIESYIKEELKAKTNEDLGVTNWVTYVGNGGPRFLLTHNPKPTSSNYALMVINVTSNKEVDQTMEKLERFSLDNFPDLLVKLRKIENGSPIENPVEVRINGTDTEQLFTLVEQVKKRMSAINGVKGVSDNWGMPIKKLQVNINQSRARRAGVSSKDIAVSLRTGMSGLELSQYREGDIVIPITMRTQAGDRQDIGKLQALAVYSQANGSSVPLTQVADIKVVWESAQILRRDRLKTITLGGQIDNTITANQAFKELLPWLEEQQKNWPISYSYELGGEFETSGKANKSIGDKLPIAGFLILLLLIAQFNSVRKAFIILLTIPLGLIGVTTGLLVGQSFIGFMTLLGIVSLAGIVINNAIILLERIQIEEQALPGNHFQAIINAAQQRFRPIVLTTATTIFGLIPLYLGGGEFWQPMAIAIMGGLLFSTVFTLGVIPVVYAVLFSIKEQ